MVSSARPRKRAIGLGLRKRLTRLSIAARFIGLLSLFLIIGTVFAQIRSTRVEFVSLTLDGEVLLHIRTPRGQTIESAQLQQGENILILEAEPIQLPITQWIVLDASDEMVNLQSVVQSNVQRFLQNTENDTGLIFYNSELNILQPSNRPEQIEDFLTNYIATADEPACLGEALNEINDTIRDFDRSWRILIITAGDFSRQSSCSTQDLPTLPAPVDIIAITDNEDTLLLDLVARSGGNISNANLRSVEARVTEVRTQWGQATYALRGEWSADWDSEASFDLSMTLSSGVSETETLQLRQYNVPIAPEPTIEPTQVVISTLPPRETVATEVAALVQNDDTTGDGSNVAFLLIVGAILFVVGAVVLAIALSRIRRSSSTHPTNNPSFYETLEEENVEAVVGATKIRDRGIIRDDNAPRMADDETNDTQAYGLTHSSQFDDDTNEDELLVTQILSDERFQQMVEQSLTDDEIVGWLRLMSESDHQDFELTSRGAIVGRSQDCDIQVLGDGAISRQHARLDVRQNGQVTISRLSAVNPVLVGGVQVSNRHPLKPNDVIHLSDRTRLIFIAKDSESDDITTS
jgi:FHA domain